MSLRVLRDIYLMIAKDRQVAARHVLWCHTIAPQNYVVGLNIRRPDELC